MNKSNTKERTVNGMAPPLLVDARELARLLSVSAATLARMKSAGKIGPKPIRVSAGRIAWRRDTIVRWIAESERLGELIDRRTWKTLDAPFSSSVRPSVRPSAGRSS